MVHILNFKVNNWGTEIAGISYIKFEHMKGRANILTSHISRLKFMRLYTFLSPQEHDKEFGHEISSSYLLYRSMKFVLQRQTYVSNYTVKK